MAEKKGKGQGDLAIAEKQKAKTKKPKRFRVLLHNDDYTTMEFVVEVLESVFRKSPSEATQIMLKVHNEGVGIAGIYSREVAETKVEQVHASAESAGYPLLASYEPE
ncbi:MAG: ATP-dependent Clp protease adaptor ClpS [Deltaproteobacteria bacterium CG2_30_63_29]|nr:MAG: ATP-dependent Clp protease adaptor ClpS [Deltaproteobacteria bacterium CG2_30_63_29]PIW02192.1 MAG: ATP-dependent Clp protease adapter ClpS [Deltaproteobacteria bacterium CG17_big_fil_post_rev_8_21_14_2_50_63_7]PJB49051.1 MAG: ATP-dependent Clp protease adapter ClpS [Deltaproteobacteria bacterium CG_4_9_14_3_um_filter_63_12]